MTESRMMIFIDLNNVEMSIQGYRDDGMYLDYTHLVDVLSEGYDLVSAKVYDSVPSRGNTALEDLHSRLEGAGFEMILKEPSGVENNMDRTCVQKEVDTSIVADAVSCAYEDSYDTAVIVSGDRDMRPARDIVARAGKTLVYASFYDVMCTEFKASEGNIVLDDLFVLEATDSWSGDMGSVVTGCVCREAVSDGC